MQGWQDGTSGKSGKRAMADADEGGDDEFLVYHRAIEQNAKG